MAVVRSGGVLPYGVTTEFVSETIFEENFTQGTITLCTCRYSSDSYMQKRSHPRQGFGGNYRRSNSGEVQNAPNMPPATSSPVTSPVAAMVASPLRKETSPHGSSPVTATNPSKSETLVKVATVMTVNKSTSESRLQLEQGPVRKPNQPPQVPPKYTYSERIQRLSTTSLPEHQALQHHRQHEDPRVKGSSQPVEDLVLMSPFTPSRTCVTNLDEASRELASKQAQFNQMNSASPTGTTRTKVSEIHETLSKSHETLTNAHDINGDASPPSKETLSKGPSILQQGSEPKGFDNSAKIVNAINTPDIQKPSSPVAVTRENGNSPARVPQTVDVPSTPPPPPPPVISHVRQKSHEEIECEKAAAVVAIQIVDEDKHLSEVIHPPPEHKTTSDFMSGIFDTNMSGLPLKPTFAKNRSPRQDENKENRYVQSSYI